MNIGGTDWLNFEGSLLLPACCCRTFFTLFENTKRFERPKLNEVDTFTVMTLGLRHTFGQFQIEWVTEKNNIYMHKYMNLLKCVWLANMKRLLAALIHITKRELKLIYLLNNMQIEHLIAPMAVSSQLNLINSPCICFQFLPFACELWPKMADFAEVRWIKWLSM